MVLLAVVVLAVLVVVGVLYWLHARHYVSTDDAYIDGNVVHLSPQVAARILVLYVDDNQLVHPGDLLVDLDPTDFQVALDRARAEVAAATGRLAEAHAGVTAAHAAVDEAAAKIVSARAALEDASSDLERYRAVDRRARSRQELDHAIAAQKDAAAGLAQAEAQKASAEARVGTATAAVETAEGSLAQARAAVVRAQVDLGYASIRATSVGRVTQRQVSAGDYVQVGQTMFSLVSPDVWVTANFKETDLTDMRPGQPVEIAIDAYPGRTFHGRVDSIQAGSGARFSILPAENATGNFVKIVQRIPVKITIDPKEIAAANVLLAPGMSVVPSVEVR